MRTLTEIHNALDQVEQAEQIFQKANALDELEKLHLIRTVLLWTIGQDNRLQAVLWKCGAADRAHAAKHPNPN